VFKELVFRDVTLSTSLPPYAVRSPVRYVACIYTELHPAAEDRHVVSTPECVQLSGHHWQRKGLKYKRCDSRITFQD